MQGVFFRDSIRTRAASLGVAGWVANRADGSVEAVLEGEEGAVAELVAFAREGPDRARVDDLRETEEQPEGLEGFRVR